MLNIPIAFFIFSRPEFTRLVFNQIRKVKPRLLLIVADGPRQWVPDDEERCVRVRSIVEQVDWDCEVRKNYANENLGCGKRVRSGLDWVFDQVEEAIILEDDCIPDSTFFGFCEELIEKYRHDDRIGQIGGVNYLFGEKMIEGSYYFSQFHYIWGWATWRRAWKGYDFNLTRWPELRDRGWLKSVFDDKGVIRYFTYSLNKTYAHEIDTWDYQWFFHCWINHRLAVLPKVNLVTNIGYQDDRATHTRNASRLAHVSTNPMDFPLIHPSKIFQNREADEFAGRNTRYGIFTTMNLEIQKQKLYAKLKEIRGKLSRDPR